MDSNSLPNFKQSFMAELTRNLVAGLAVSFVAISLGAASGILGHFSKGLEFCSDCVHRLVLPGAIEAHRPGPIPLRPLPCPKRIDDAALIP